mmetsp:Transcript_11473/g.29321  ORF Transcript_11473/g.29321 Transcript_11473/m.29321 type:complete len:240 (-) Transcript_11473:1916-2635(-)
MQPKVVHGGGGLAKIVLFESSVGILDGARKARKNPLVRCEVGAELSRGLEPSRQLAQAKFGRLPHLVAEHAVAMDLVDVEIDVSAREGEEVAQAKAQGVNTALRNAVGIVFCLTLLGLLNLFWRKVAVFERLLQLTQCNPIPHIHRVDNVAQALRHFPAMRISNKRMKIDRREGELSGEVLAHHDHARDPEKENIVACLEEVAWVELVEVWCLVGPSKDRNGENAGREPGVEDVFVPPQ